MRLCGLCLAVWTILGLLHGDLAKHETDPWKMEPPPPRQMEPLTGFAIPTLKMLKRQVRNFRQGRTASITLVFKASQPTTVRWFMLHPKWRPGQSEVRNHLPIEADPHYRVTFIPSADVTATTLSIKHFKDKWPRDFETIFTLEDGSMQYQLRTSVSREIDLPEAENIDSPEWMMIPPPRWQFPLGRRLVVPCKVFIPRERSSATNELVLFQEIVGTTVTEHEKTVPHIEYEWLFEMNKLKTTRSEEDPIKGIVVKGHHKVWQFRSHLYAMYYVEMETENTTRVHEGIYLCALEREFDKQYVISSLSSQGNPSPFMREPHADLISCEKRNYDDATGIMTFVEGHTTCLRCRGFGYPRPEIGLFISDSEGEEEVLETGNGNIRVKKYINVADAGVAEATYIFRRPARALEGKYSCKAHNGIDYSHWYFQIVVN